MSKIYYTKGYEAVCKIEFEVELEDCPDTEAAAWVNGRISKPFAYIERRFRDGEFAKYFLVIKVGYACDLATWAVDTKSIIRGSFCHDVLLELIGLGKLRAAPWKKWADNFLIKLCKEDKMWWIRRQWVYRAVRKLGDPQGSKPRKVYSAP